MENLLTDLGAKTWLPDSLVAVRLFAALLCGAAVRYERERRSRAAGLRTHHKDFAEQSIRVDPIRLIEAVTSGVAFLAAELIVFTKGEVKGLTTGAGLWLSSATGLACGLGLLRLALLATALALIVLWLLHILEIRLKLRDKG
ncbi:MgtC/SapB family protein [Ciceribacter azotifigens]|uniref:MgtC/SapB family protein n=1 Tax=Ciceribacter azotifigens TaxID=2069303 RepID=UPI003A85E7B4